MDILNDMGVNKLSAIFFLKVNYSFKHNIADILYKEVLLACAELNF